ncbi:ER membrane protein complex subunit 5, putative [Hepatocystis sp. ex Piliocolobus tephrosceles]|nr:ER membrane protein complex subunit 5, putative [Hepatocystis sp. ex Piliocolobus tephrosceles]
MVEGLPVSLTLIGLASLLHCGYKVYLLLHSFKKDKDNIDDFTLDHTVILQIFVCAIITLFGGSKLFLSFQNINDESSQDFDHNAWDKNHCRKNYRPCYNRKYHIKTYINDTILKYI